MRTAPQGTDTTPPRRFLAFIESNMTGTGIQALKLARANGYRVAFLTADFDRYAADLDAIDTIVSQADEVVTCDTQDVHAMEKVLRSLPVPVLGVMTVMDHFVPLAAATAQRLGLPGLSPQAADKARNKLRTRVACAERGVAVPAFRFVSSPAEIDAALDVVGLPCVLKPVDESASIGVALCRTRQEVHDRISLLMISPINSRGQRRTPGGLIEECLFGHEVSVETFTYGGQTRVLGVTDKLLGPTPHFIELGHTFPSFLPETSRRAVADLAVAALDAIGFDFGPAHTEVKLTGQGPFLIEINARSGGDFVPDLVHHATGIALLEESITAHAGGEPDLRPKRKRGAAIRFLVGRRGVVEAVPDLSILSNFPTVVSSRIKVAPGWHTRWPTNSHDRIGYVMTCAPTAPKAAADADAALAHLNVTYREAVA
ncbi:ATP-grasp domain-containing protein [Micromonospora sp. WMMD980]|uniref:ATP-grasp domain-containing protein n=1 Tax=Micromonospora sp. WMMD980 TaxID=3016088 RepID=UPI002416346F|nr:ATP-grasp domain-containing protein [Micromonospora sp. WMMD980]MDG4803222.1 ATP-grasp domain-containing protein [Micromonospora sp. WMMD980]